MSQYSEYVEDKGPRLPIVPTDWDYVLAEFSDIIGLSIVSGNKEGPGTYPIIRKTIRIKHGGGELHASEYIQDRKNEPAHLLQFEYDWKYDPSNAQASWKFHYDTYHPKEYWTTTQLFHQHDHPNSLKTSHKRESNFAARNVCAVLETIRVALRVSGKLP